MTGLSEIFGILNLFKWIGKAWSRLKKSFSMRAHVSDLEKRVQNLETLLSEKKDLPPGEKCPGCSLPAFRMISRTPFTVLPNGTPISFRTTKQCSECGFSETNVSGPSSL